MASMLDKASNVAVAATLVAATGCWNPDTPTDLGRHPDDAVFLVDAPMLRYIADQLPPEDRDTVRVEDLFGYREGVPWEGPPTPLVQQEAQAVVHESLGPLEPDLTLRVLTYNVALLSRWYPFTRVEVPEIESRRERFAEVLLDDGWDILMLQEVWDNGDIERLEQAAEEHGYTVLAGDDKHELHGLATVIRDDLIAGDGEVELDEVIYQQQRSIERFPGPGVARGFLAARFRLAGTDVDVAVYNTHMTAFASFWRERAGQARELSLHTRDDDSGDEIVLLGGDFNAAPYYSLDTFGEVAGEPVTGWFNNTIMYGLLLYYGRFQDISHISGTVDDHGRMDGLPTYDVQRWLETPLGEASQCAGSPDTFTASDCNSLYFQNYGAEEYPARIDYLFFRDDSGKHRVRVIDSTLEYQSPLDFGEAGEFELSDHYGVSAELDIADL